MKLIYNILSKISSQDQAIQTKEIISSVSRQSRAIKTRVAGMVREFKIDLPNDTGIKIYRSTDYYNAQYVRDASKDEIERYLKIFPQAILILIYQDQGMWYGVPAYKNQYECVCRSDSVNIVPIQNVNENLDRFDYVYTRFDGSLFWYEDIDYRVDPNKLDQMREYIKKIDWGSKKRLVDDPKIYELHIKGLTEEDRFGYQLAVRRVIQDIRDTFEDRLRDHLRDVNVKLDSYIEHGNKVEVRWINASGQPYTTVIQKDGFRVVTAGICVSGEDKKFDLKSLVSVVTHAERVHGIVRVGHEHMGEDSYFDIYPEPRDLGGRGGW